VTAGTTRRTALILVALVGMACAGGKLDAEMAKYRVPPAWFDAVTTTYDMKTPWKDARLHVRKLLGEGKGREAMKISHTYHAENRGSKDGHEWPMYFFLGGDYVWAAKVYKERIEGRTKGYVFEIRALASIYTRFGDYDQALDVLRLGLRTLPDPPERTMAEADIHDAMGDTTAAKGDSEKAVEHYNQAMALFGKARPRYGRHLLPRRIRKVQSKIDLIGKQSLDITRIANGVYRGESLGYGKPLRAFVTVKGGKVTDIRLQHEEKIEQGATKSVPKQIIERQSLDVDAVTGATITVQAIVEATYRALSGARRK